MSSGLAGKVSSTWTTASRSRNLLSLSLSPSLSLSLSLSLPPSHSLSLSLSLPPSHSLSLSLSLSFVLWSCIESHDINSSFPVSSQGLIRLIQNGGNRGNTYPLVLGLRNEAKRKFNILNYEYLNLFPRDTKHSCRKTQFALMKDTKKNARRTWGDLKEKLPEARMKY